MFAFFARLVRLHLQSSQSKSSSRKSKPSRYRQLSVQALDERQLLSVTPISSISTSISTVMIGPVIAPTQQQIDQQMGLPALDSLPGAPATLYLDFDGNYLSSWSTGGKTYTNVSTPVWDMDGNTSSFSAAEQAVIKEVWARVAEDYAPFNINVSTDYYGTFNNGQALQVCIGGNNTDWLNQNASGISSIGSFHDSQPNVVFAFDMVAWAKAGVTDGEGRPLNGPEAMATTISHEAGHSFGLLHHSTYDASGHLVDEYDPGSSNWTPIMGNNLADDRTTWANLPTDQGPNNWQDDMAVIGGANNGFGFRADDHGDTTATADALVRSGSVQSITSPLVGKGIINQPSDKDFFKFTAPGGSVQIEVDSAKYGPNLLPVLQLWSSSGLVANAGYVTPTRSIITANLPAGSTYYVMVKGLGEYGDVGQYTVSVSPVLTSIAPTTATTSSTTFLATPSLSTTTASSPSSTTKLVSAGNGQSGTLTDVTRQTVLSPVVANVAPSLSPPSAKFIPAAPSASIAPVRNVHALRPAIVDALFAREGDLALL
jgi:hypothetical protein